MFMSGTDGEMTTDSMAFSRTDREGPSLSAPIEPMRARPAAQRGDTSTSASTSSADAAKVAKAAAVTEPVKKASSGEQGGDTLTSVSSSSADAAKAAKAAVVTEPVKKASSGEQGSDTSTSVSSSGADATKAAKAAVATKPVKKASSGEQSGQGKKASADAHQKVASAREQAESVKRVAMLDADFPITQRASVGVHATVATVPAAHRQENRRQPRHSGKKSKADRKAGSQATQDKTDDQVTTKGGFILIGEKAHTRAVRTSRPAARVSHRHVQAQAKLVQQVRSPAPVSKGLSNAPLQVHAQAVPVGAMEREIGGESASMVSAVIRWGTELFAKLGGDLAQHGLR